MAARKYSSANARKPARKLVGNADMYSAVADRFIAKLEAGTVPWRQPWSQGGIPMRMSANKPYRGINTWLLAMAAMDSGYASPWWGTYDQIAELSGMERRERPNGHKYWVSPDGTPRGVRAGEKSTRVILVKEFTKTETDEATGERVTRKIKILRWFWVFNAAQAEQLPARYYPAPAAAADASGIALAEDALHAYFASGPALHHDVGGQAFYDIGADTVHMPPLADFPDPAEYASTKAHEAVHSTGHASRLNRLDGQDMGMRTHARGVEELTAEMGAAFILAQTGVETAVTFDNSAAYLAGWIRNIRENPKIIMRAATAAQAAADYIFSTDPATDETDEDGNALEDAPILSYA